MGRGAGGAGRALSARRGCLRRRWRTGATGSSAGFTDPEGAIPVPSLPPSHARARCCRHPPTTTEHRHHPLPPDIRDIRRWEFLAAHGERLLKAFRLFSVWEPGISALLYVDFIYEVPPRPIIPPTPPSLFLAARCDRGGARDACITHPPASAGFAQALDDVTMDFNRVLGMFDRLARTLATRRRLLLSPLSLSPPLFLSPPARQSPERQPALTGALLPHPPNGGLRPQSLYGPQLNRNRVRAIAAAVLSAPDLLPQPNPRNSSGQFHFELWLEFLARVARASFEAVLRSRAKMGLDPNVGGGGGGCDPLPFENVRAGPSPSLSP